MLQEGKANKQSLKKSWIHHLIFIMDQTAIAQLAGAVEYTDCFSAEG